MFDIYTIYCRETDTHYVGRSVELEKRWRSHRNMLRTGTHYNTRMQSDWDTYGEESFVFTLINTAEDKDTAIAMEQTYIDSFDNKYNIADAKDGGDTFTNNPRASEITELKRKIFSGKGNPMYGKPKTQKMIDRVKEVNSKKVSVNGVIYSSMTAAAKAFGVCVSTVSNRSKSSSFPEWCFVDK